MKDRNKIKKYLGATLFLMIGLFLFIGISRLLQRKWILQQDYEVHHYTFQEYNDLTKNKNDIQAIFLGTSHVLYSVDPMQIYSDTGIATFNLATSAQSIESSYYLAKECIERCNPKIIFLDASRLFTRNDDYSWYYLVIDNLNRYEDQVGLVSSYLQDTDTYSFNSLIDNLMVINKYHDRWKSLLKSDFEPQDLPTLFRKGYMLSTQMSRPWGSVEWMNEIEESNSDTGTEIRYENGNKLRLDREAYKNVLIKENGLTFLSRMPVFSEVVHEQ